MDRKIQRFAQLISVSGAYKGTTERTLSGELKIEEQTV